MSRISDASIYPSPESLVLERLSPQILHDLEVRSVFDPIMDQLTLQLRSSVLGHRLVQEEPVPTRTIANSEEAA